MKHVWILNHYAEVPSGIGSTRHFSLAKAMKHWGWSATVVAASVEHATGRQRLNRRQTGHETIEEVPFVWLRTPTYRGNGWWRIVNILTYTARAIWPPTTRALPRPDVVVGSSVHPLSGWAASVLARRSNVPFVLEIRDLWPETLVQMGRLKRGSLMERALARLEVTLYRQADAIIVLLPNAASYITSLGISDSKITYIPNGPDMRQFPVTEPTSSPKLRLMYVGAHGQANDIENIIEAVRIVRCQSPSTNIELRLVGDGPRKTALKDLVQRYKLDNVVFEPPVARRDVPQLAADTDSFIVSLKDLPLYQYGISLNKIFDHMACARPVIFAGKASNNPIAEASAGICVEPSNPSKLAVAMSCMSQIPQDERTAMGLSGRRYVEHHFSAEVLAERFASLLTKCQAEHRKVARALPKRAAA